MAHIFISYSRADRAFVDEFVPLLRKVYADTSTWFDEAIPGGHQWWQLILNEIAICDLFIYLLSNDSLASPYCQAEFREALRLQKPFLPVIVRSKTEVGSLIPDDLADILRQTQFVDVSGGFKDYQASAALYAAINSLLKHSPLRASAAPSKSQPVREPSVFVRESPRPKSIVSRWPILLGGLTLGACSLVLLMIVLNSLQGVPRGGGTRPTVSVTHGVTNTPQANVGATYTVSDPIDNAAPDFRQLTITYDTEIIQIVVDFSKPQDVDMTKQEGNFVYLYGDLAHNVSFNNVSFELQLDKDNNGHFETILFKGTVDHPSATSIMFRFPANLMPDIAKKRVWAYSMTSKDLIPDSGQMQLQ
jgi:hypothetical protein